MDGLSVSEKRAIQSKRLKFTEMAKVINSYIKEEEGFSLTFLGYTDTIIEYLKVTNENFEGLGSLALELNLWSDYFGQLKGFIEIRVLKFENKLLYLEGFYDKKIVNEELEKQIKDVKKKFAHFKLFLKHVETQCKMFEKAHKYCLKAYTEALGNLIYKYDN